MSSTGKRVGSRTSQTYTYTWSQPYNPTTWDMSEQFGGIIEIADDLAEARHVDAVLAYAADEFDDEVVIPILTATDIPWRETDREWEAEREYWRLVYYHLRGLR